MAYSTVKDVWNWLNGSTKIYQEIVTSSCNGTTLNYNLTNSSVISGSIVIRYAGVTTGYLTASTLTSSLYTFDYDRGILQLTTGGATTCSASTIFADYEYSSINDTILKDIISSSDREIDRKTGRNWNSNSTVTEYISVDNSDATDYYTKNYPHITMDEVAENENDASDTAKWVTRGAGLGNDYLTTDEDKLMGRIRFIDNLPEEGTDNLRVKYTWGNTSVPYEIKRLSVLYTVKTILQNPAFANQIIKGRDTFLPLSTEVIQAEIDKTLTELRKFKLDRV